MNNYKPPLRDIEFVAKELLDFPAHYRKIPDANGVDWDTISTINQEYGKFCENTIAPLYRVGDIEGCKWSNGEVTTPTGYKEAYQQYVAAGWPSMIHSQEYGGQGLPSSLAVMTHEMSATADFSWSSYPSLSAGAMKTISAHGTDAQKQRYLPGLVSGQWTGTMCLTEPHCGSDLGMLKTKAVPNGDGTYSITGTKIFISGGEHDLSENIVHIVIARIQGAPEGTKGISLFVVPKFNVNEQGNVIDRNSVHCGSIEHKMGLHGSATCVMNFDGAKAELIGRENKGLASMFTFMNIARTGTAVQGIVHSELGYQKSLSYARDRLQGRSLKGHANPEGPADPIIAHPDIRRMLMTQKAFTEGHRMLTYHCAKLGDIVAGAEKEHQREAADRMLGFLTPIAKGFISETSFESANLAVQCFGGHGFISEAGVEQNVRDCRISTLYEGTTGIQGLDLLGRKIIGSGGVIFEEFLREIADFCERHAGNDSIEPFTSVLKDYVTKWRHITEEIVRRGMSDPDEVGAASVDYLMYSGYVVSAYFWAQAAVLVVDRLKTGPADEVFYRSKLVTAQFYYRKLLPRASALAETILSGSDTVMALEEADFSF